MNIRTIAAALTFGALSVAALSTYAGPRTAIVDADCKTTRGKLIDCTQQKCVNREGKRVESCPTAPPAAPVAPTAPQAESSH